MLHRRGRLVGHLEPGATGHRSGLEPTSTSRASARSRSIRTSSASGLGRRLIEELLRVLLDELPASFGYLG